MSSYSKQASNSFQKHSSYQKPSPLKSKEINESSKVIDKGTLPGRYPVPPKDKTLSSTVNQDQVIKNTQASTKTTSSTSPTSTTYKNIATNNKPPKSSSIIGGTSGNKYHPNNNSNNNIKWRRNNFPLFYGGYPTPGRINVPSNLPFFGRGYPTDANLYFPSGICPPHYSPAHHPHIRQQHLAHQRLLALSPVTPNHPYQKYLTLNHINNLRRSRSAHGSFRSKVSSSPHPQQVTNR